MSHLVASLRSGNWKALLACFLYFDTGFTTWVMFGPLAPFISKQISLTPIQAGFLVAVPVLAASIVRVTLRQPVSVRQRPAARVARYRALVHTGVCAASSDCADLHPAVGSGRVSRRGRREFRHRAADGGQQLSAARARAGARAGRRGQHRRGCGWIPFSRARAEFRLAACHHGSDPTARPDRGRGVFLGRGPECQERECCRARSPGSGFLLLG